MTQFNGELTSDRLRLIPLSVENLRLRLRDQAELERRLGLQGSAMALDVETREAIEKDMLVAIEQDPEGCLWATEWLIVLKAENRIIGSLGFKGQPDDKGEAELGYGMSPDYRRRGYMTEAVAEAMSWALGHENCTSVIAEVARDNIASIRVLEKVAMVPYRETNQFLYWRRSRVGRPGGEESAKEPAL